MSINISLPPGGSTQALDALDAGAVVALDREPWRLQALRGPLPLGGTKRWQYEKRGTPILDLLPLVESAHNQGSIRMPLFLLLLSSPCQWVRIPSACSSWTKTGQTQVCEPVGFLGLLVRPKVWGLFSPRCFGEYNLHLTSLDWIATLGCDLAELRN